MKLYHLSKDNLDGKTLYPRIPEFAKCVNDDSIENTTTPRICFSLSISGAYRALNTAMGGYEIYYVHILDSEVNDRNIIKCTEKDVADSIITDEYWVTCPVKLKCIGKVSIGYDGSTKETQRHIPYFYDGDMSHPIYKNHVHYRYIERYNQDSLQEQLVSKVSNAIYEAIKTTLK